MKLLQRAIAACVVLALTTTAHAVHLDPSGRGQVLIYPHYNVTEHKQTLLSVTNTMSVAQVAKVRFNESHNGRTALSFNLWLAPFDTWTATVFDLSDTGSTGFGAAILTTDTSCTSPAFSSSGLSVNGTAYLPFTNAAFSGALADGMSTSLYRTQEGSIEIIAMADVASPLAELIAHPVSTGTTVGPTPSGCAQVSELSLIDPAMSKPSGGLLGSASIINVSQGTLLATRAEALDGFTAVPLFTSSDADQPTLASVNDAGNAETATASVPVTGGSVQTLTFRDTPSGSQRVDAVSAVLMATQIFNEFQRSTELQAGSDWLFTFPTRRFYVQSFADGGVQERAPFQSSSLAPGYLQVSWNVRDRESREHTFPGCGFICPGGPPRTWWALWSTATSRITFKEPFSIAYHPVLGENGTRRFEVGTAAGWAAVNLANQQQRQLPASVEGKILYGLPVIGFWASNVVNNNVINGVLANYSAAVRHATSVTCTRASDGTPCD